MAHLSPILMLAHHSSTFIIQYTTQYPSHAIILVGIIMRSKSR